MNGLKQGLPLPLPKLPPHLLLLCLGYPEPSALCLRGKEKHRKKGSFGSLLCYASMVSVCVSVCVHVRVRS